MAGQKIGTLEIEILTNIARLQSEMKQIQRAVGDATDDIGKKVGAANDNINSMGTTFQRTGQRVVASAGQQRAGMQQLSFQIGDVAQQFALGTNPMIIFAQQGGQVVQALNMMKGGAGGLIGFLGGPWGAVIMGAGMILGTLVSKMMEAKDASDKVSFSSYALKDAQGILGGVMDMTTGKITTQNGALIALARAQLLVARVQSQTRLAAARSQIADSATPEMQFSGGMGGGISFGRARPIQGQVASQFQNGVINTDQAVQKLELMRRAGRITADTFNELAAAYANAGVELANEKVWNDAEKMLNGGSGKGTGLLNAAKKGGKKAGNDGAKEYAAAFLAKVKAQFEADWEKMAPIADAYKRIGIDVNTEMSAVTEDLIKQQQARTAGLTAEVDRVNALGDQYAALGQAMNAVGGSAARVFTIIDSLRTGNFTGIGGRTGYALSQVAAIGIGTNAKGEIETLGDRITSIFNGKNSAFGKTMSEILQGGTTGMAVGSILFGKSKAGQTGSAIGGALGSVLGPMGSIIGSVIGVIGKLTAKTKKGSASLVMGADGLEIGSVTGNSGSRKAAASQAAGGVIDALLGIAEALGGDLTGTAAVSIGMRKKSYVVDPTGQGRTKGAGVLNFGQDAEAAVKAAIVDAIRDGAITGMSEAVKRLLTGGSDIEKQLVKAQKFQGALDDVKNRMDPLGYAFEALGRELESLQKIATEAGASEAELAQLRQYSTLKTQDVIKQAQQDALDKLTDKRTLEIRLLELLGKQTEAVAAAREMEVLGLEESLRPLQQLIYQLEDARAVMDTFQPLADDLKAYRAELLSAGAGNASLAYLTAQFNTTAALAKGGDATALGGLRASGGAYLDAAMAGAGSAFDARLARGRVLAAVDQGIFAADTKVDYAQVQIQAIERQTDIMASVGNQIAAQNAAIAENTRKMADFFTRVEVDGMIVRSDTSEPVLVSVV